MALLQVLSEALAWVTSAILDFGLALLDVRALLTWAKDALGNAGAAGVRNSAIQMLGAMHMWVKDFLRLSICAPPQPHVDAGIGQSACP